MVGEQGSDGGGAAELITAELITAGLTPVRAAYESSADSWADGPQRMYRALADALIALAAVPLGGATVLDLGAGTGVAGQAALAAGAREVVAADLAVGMLRWCPAELHPVAADAIALPFRDGSFDLVLAAFSLSHLGSLAAGLAEVRRVGRAIAAELQAEGVPFVVLDSQAELEPDLRRDDRCYLIGDASDEAVLRQARIDRARGLICAVDSDAENVFITIVARSLSADLLIVARAAREHSADRLYRAGATHVVSPYVTSGRRMASLAIRPQVVEFFDVARAGSPGPRLEEIEVNERSALVGWRLQDLSGSAVPLLVRHPDGQLVASPPADLQLRAGDVLVVFGAADDLRPLGG